MRDHDPQGRGLGRESAGGLFPGAGPTAVAANAIGEDDQRWWAIRPRLDAYAMLVQLSAIGVFSRPVEGQRRRDPKLLTASGTKTSFIFNQLQLFQEIA